MLALVLGAAVVAAPTERGLDAQLVSTSRHNEFPALPDLHDIGGFGGGDEDAGDSDHSGRVALSVALKAGSTGDQICMHGKAVPTLINVGAPKCGTTTLSEMANAAGALPFAASGYKEADAFGDPENAATDTINEADRQAFAGHSGFACNQDTPTLYDMTPNYMSIPGMPRRVSEIYASNSPALCITAIIREPMARLQSHMYYGPKEASMNAAKANTWAREDLDKLREHNVSTYDAMIGDYASVPPVMARFGLYGLQMKEWLTYFKPSRTVVMPMMWAMDNQEEALELINAQCPHLRLNVSGVADMGDDEKHALNSAHMADKQPAHGLVFTKQVIQDYRQFYDEDEKTLAHVLSDHTSTGLAIGGLTPGIHHEPAEILAHFRRHWGAKD
jgi:hypothetical protein